MAIERMTQPALVLLMALTPCVVLAVVALYAWWLHRAPPRRASRSPAGDYPTIDIIVPVFNEATILAAKLANVSALKYARDCMRIIITDGASTDGSREIAEAWARRDARAVVVATERPGKAAQLNAALDHSEAAWIVVTDADAHMEAHTLQALMRAADESAAGVIGSPILPLNTHPAEQLYWRLLNWLRLREWRRGSASMVMAPCYAFRRDLVDHIPEDVISDDVYVAWRIASSGGLVGIAGPVVHEIRGALTLPSLFRQKLRRASGVVREIFRFLPCVRSMSLPFGAGFVLRSGLMFLGPLVAGSALGLLIAAGSWLQGNAIGATPLMGLVVVLSAAPLVRCLRCPLTVGAIVPLAAILALMMYPLNRRDQRATVSIRRGKNRPAYSP